MESSTAMDQFGEEDIFNTILRFGLLLGGIFQLACIGACIFLPSPDNLGTEGDNSDDNSALLSSSRRQHYKIRKQEKKKRR